MPRFFAFATKSINSWAAAPNFIVADMDMTAEQTIVGDDYVVPDFAVVSDMRADHEKILVADFGYTVFGTAAMNRAMLANDIVVSDHDIGLAVGGEGKVLRRGA